MMRKNGILLVAAALVACTQQHSAAARKTEDARIAATPSPTLATESGDYFTKLPLNEFMPHVMQYSADGIWKRQGYIIDAKGEHSLFPKNDEEWEEAESGARTLAEITNVLLLPGRRVDEGEWTQAVKRVRAVALQAADAAERKDAKAFFAAGGELDVACDDCHVRYDPSFKNNPTKTQ